MAIEEMDRIVVPGRSGLAAAGATGGVARFWRYGAVLVRLAARRLARAAGRLPVHRIFTSLARRIFLANLLGLLILISGIIYISQDQSVLISAKRESLKVQGQIIAAAIAANAKIVGGEDITLEPDKLPNVEGARIPFRDDGFAAFELSISPENIQPILKRLIKETDTRARVYSREYTMVVDSDLMLSNRLFQRAKKRRSKAGSGTAAKGRRDIWTKLTEWFTPNTLPVYYEVNSADGGRYTEVRTAMTGTPMATVLLTPEGQQIVSVATPIKRMNAVQGVLWLTTHPGEIDAILSAERRIILMLSAMALAATLVASALLTQTISRPMRQLSRAAGKVRQNISAREELPTFPHRTDEVRQVAVAFSDMTAALYRRIEASEKFAGDVAHELKNPLAAARVKAEALTYAKTEAERDEQVRQIQKELRRLNRLITDVANVSRLDAELARQTAEPVDLRNVLSGVCNAFNDLLSESNCRVELDIPDLPEDSKDFVVGGHDGRLAQVVRNLVDNAISFSPGGGVVTVRARRTGAEVEVRVLDEGPGIPGDLLEKIFARFYSDRPATEAENGKNSGLGLSISREIIVAHKGRIWAENLGTPLVQQSREASAGVANRSGDGTAFVFRLPAAYPRLYRGLRGRARIERWA